MGGVILSALAVLLLLGGLFGMRWGLQHMLSGKMKTLLTRITVTPWTGLAAGIVAAAFMQSSTAVSIITIGLVSANYLSFYQSLGLILGANIGTCTTVQMMAFVSLPDKYLVTLAGLLTVSAIAAKRVRPFSTAALGLVSMFLGLSMLPHALGKLAYMDTIIGYVASDKHNPIYGIFSGMLITALFQSSSAATGFLMALAEQDLIDITTAAYIVYGNNIGSCISSVIIGVAAPLAAKRVALAHFLLNVLGVAVFIPFTNLLTLGAAYLSPDFAEQIALMHTIFNVVCSLAVMPIVKQYAKLILALTPNAAK
ncbi:MAG: Na/Pi symporter [Negativicutes bacterium]|nr:Na/Pi symporter [Negativicutes bacterium]